MNPHDEKGPHWFVPDTTSEYDTCAVCGRFRNAPHRIGIPEPAAVGKPAPHVEDCPWCGARHARFDRTHACRLSDLKGVRCQHGFPDRGGDCCREDA